MKPIPVSLYLGPSFGLVILFAAVSPLVAQPSVPLVAAAALGGERVARGVNASNAWAARDAVAERGDGHDRRRPPSVG